MKTKRLPGIKGYRRALNRSCMDRCDCATPVTCPCGCVNHSGGEITYCALHGTASELLTALADILEHKVPADWAALERLSRAARAAVNKARGLHA